MGGEMMSGAQTSCPWVDGGLQSLQPMEIRKQVILSLLVLKEVRPNHSKSHISPHLLQKRKEPGTGLGRKSSTGEYGYSNMEGIIRLLNYGEQQGGLVPLTSQLKGSCLFSSFRKSLVCPFEFTNTHLRRMLVMFMCEQLDFLYPMLRLSISGNYGHIRVSSTEYDRLKGLSDPTRAQCLQMEEYEEPGPFSIITYIHGESFKAILLWRRNLLEVIVHDLPGAHHSTGL